MAELRRCAESGCTTVLSRYNPEDYCGLHATVTLPQTFESEEPKRSHVKRGVLPSQTKDPAAYRRAYRAARPTYALENRLGTRARAAAALIVAKRHPKEFATAIAVERQRRGLSVASEQPPTTESGNNDPRP